MTNNENLPENIADTIPSSIQGLYQEYYLDYASYVILDRAVPSQLDGLKPVQRRIMHTMKEMDDGRFNKVANIIGTCMRYHPHGDASIGDALVNLGQKDLLVETQGNWGNAATGDRAAAPRYIEARLSKFANAVLFNKNLTKWVDSYDGRGKEPITLPAKFPLVLAHGAEGIAVGLATKILPHNFIELIDASISILRKESFKIYPDFSSGGLIDVSEYNDGQQGGKIKLRARIKKLDAKTLQIYEIPYETTTSSLIESIILANDKGKLKVKKVEDNTAKDVDILVHLPTGANVDRTIAALYAFTKCEMSISPNSCVIDGIQPSFIGASELLIKCTERTKEVLRLELEFERNQYLEKIFFATLEQIFIENKIYRSIEECETWEAVLATIAKKLSKFVKDLHRDVNQDDIIKLTEIKIKRISKFDKTKSDAALVALQEALSEVEKNLKSLTRFAIRHFKELKKNFSKGKERKSEITAFSAINKTKVAAANNKLFVNLKDGFVGTSLKKETYLFDCSDLDEIICFTADGRFKVLVAPQKAYIGKNIMHIAIFRRNDENTTYNLIYQDGRGGNVMIKRFFVKSITREKEYDLTKGNPGSRVLYFSVNRTPEEQEIVRVLHNPAARLKKKVIEVDFKEVPIKGRSTGGNILTRHGVKKIERFQRKKD